MASHSIYALCEPPTLHVMYTDKDGKFHQANVAMTFRQVEVWLIAIGARYWEIGV